MSIKKRFVIAFAFLLLHLGIAGAVGVLAPAANRVDMVHDEARNVIYITSGGNVLRYDIASATFLAPIALGGNLKGIDMSPDGSTLVVADQASDSVNEWVYLVRLSDLAVTKAATPKAFMEDGAYAVVYEADGNVLVTFAFAGSGWVTLRELNPATLQWTSYGQVRQNTMVSASGNGSIVAFAEANESDGPWGTFNVATKQLVHRTGYTDGTSWFNFEIATNANGSQFAIPTYGGTFIYDSTYTKIGTIGTYAGALPIGVAYHPVEPLIYFPWTTTGEVRVYNATSLAQVGAYDFQDTFQWNGGAAYAQGRTKLSRDGSLLMVTVTGGVRYLQMYAPLAAAPVTGAVNAGSAVTLGLKGSIGNGGQIGYALASSPAHGSASINGNYVTYTPAAGFIGADTFTYAAKYGVATVQSTVSVTVTQPNRAPVAVNDVAQTTRDKSVLIPVLANDSDPDGDALSITMTTKPANGSVSIQSGKILYTPQRNFRGTNTFTYTISDGKGGSASAQVTVTVKLK